MSAEFKDQDKRWKLQALAEDRLCNPTEETLLVGYFDEDTDYHIDSLKKQYKNIKFLKKVCFIKLISSVPEYIFSLLFFSKQIHRTKRKLIILYFKFLINKIDYSQFKKQLNILKEDSFL